MALLTRRRIKYVARNSGPVKRWGIIGWALLSSIVHRVERKFSIKKGAFTLLAFSLLLLILPVFVISFAVLGFYRQAIKRWISWIENGEVEVADVAFRTAMETSEQAAILTFVFSVEGSLQEDVIKNWLTEMIDQKDSRNGKSLHFNFKRQLIRTKGFFAWKRDPEFCLDNHIVAAPSHHHGTTLTERNIQECISEMCSDPLRSGQSPWEVKIAKGVTEGGDPVTWVIFRIHHLLATDLRLPGFPSSLPNPWDSGCLTRGYSVLEAPNGTKRLFLLITDCIHFSVEKVLGFIFIFMHKTVKTTSDIVNQNELKKLYEFQSIRLLCAIQSVNEAFRTIFVSTSKKTNKNQVVKFIAIVMLQKSFIFIFNFIVNLILKMYRFCAYIRTIFLFINLAVIDIFNGKNPYVNLCVQGVLELYWMVRAMLSLPRLLMEEMFATRGTVPLHVWSRKGVKNWKRTLVSWSEEVPLGGAEEIQGVTGASLSSVLLTALSGGIRDLVRYSGAQPPDCLRCTLPVYIPHIYPNQGLLPFKLPTGCSYGQKALREVCRYIDRMKKYPETYLASVWLVKHVAKFLPEIILKRFLKFLTASHPILLINLVGPSSSTYLWGLKLKSTFYWRPPQHDAVISVCISSYCGRVSLGVLADGWAVPHANILPQSFASHLNELAVEAGVKLQRQNSKVWSRISSPRSTPSPTPPPTPSVNKGWIPFSQSALSATLRRQRKLKQSIEAKKDDAEDDQVLNKHFENPKLKTKANELSKKDEDL